MKFPSILALEKLMQEKLAPGMVLDPELDVAQIRLLMAEADEDVQQTFQVILGVPIGTDLVSRHLDLLYKQCRGLSNTLFGYGQGQGLQGDLREEVQSCLMGLMDYLLIQHDDLLNPALLVPALHFTVAMDSLEAAQPRMLALMKQFHIDPKLQTLVLSKISKLRKKGKASWAQLRHLENIQQFIGEEFNGRFGNHNQRLCGFLQRSNFNADGFLDYSKAALLKSLEDIPGPVEQYRQLCDLERIFKTSYYKKDMLPYEARLPYVKAVLLEYVRAEMECLRKKERGLSKPVIVLNTPAAAPQVVDPEREGAKLSVSCSVEVLAYFFRLLIEQGLVTNPSRASVLRFLCSHVETPGSASRDISLKSMENKYKQVLQSTLSSTRAILQKMMKQLEETCA